MKRSNIGSTTISLMVGPLSIYFWQPRDRWSIGRMDCPEWCCRWNAYFGPLGVEWALPTAVADKLLDEGYEQEALANQDVQPEVNGVVVKDKFAYDVDF